MIRFLILACFFISSFVNAEEDFNKIFSVESENALLKEIQHSNIKVTELHLKNGMKVILKPTNFDPLEVHYRLFARGGYTALPVSQYAAGKLATSCAWESGFTDLTADKVSTLLYENSIEFAPQILPFNRLIEGSSHKASLEILFKLFNWFFTKHQVSYDSFQTVIEKEKENIRRRAKNQYDNYFEEAINALNMPHLKIAHQLTTKDVKNIELKNVVQILEEAFTNPSEFTLVLVGDFEVEKIKPFLIQWLEAIPIKENQGKFLLGPSLTYSFPKGVTSKIINIQHRTDSLVRMTFPVLTSADAEKVVDLELICLLIRNYLKNHLSQKFQSRLGVEVSFEFPLHFSQEFRLIIQYHCDPKINALLTSVILSELKQFQKKGISKEEFSSSLSQLKQESDFFMQENDFWLVFLSNYFSWGWDPQHILKRFDKPEAKRIQDVQELLQNQLVLDNYTILTAQPLP